MTTVQRRPLSPPPPITWAPLPADVPLPDDPVDDILHPLLCGAVNRFCKNANGRSKPSNRFFRNANGQSKNANGRINGRNVCGNWA